MNIENKPESTNRCILELPLKYDKHEHTILNTMFRVANDMKNNLIGWYLNQYREMIRTKKWRNNQVAIHQLYVDYAPGIKDLGKLKAKISRKISKCQKNGINYTPSLKDMENLDCLQKTEDEFKEKKAALYEIRNGMLAEHGFSKFSFQERMKKYRKSYETLVGSAVAQRIADTVWDMFQAKLFGNGKAISFSPFTEFLSIEGKSNKTNIVFNRKTMTVTFGKKSNQVTLRVKRNRRDPYGYEETMLGYEVCYCRIVRKAYPEGWRYFLQLVLKGTPPVKIDSETGEILHSIGKGCVGLDIGTQTLAFSGDHNVGLEVLAEDIQNDQNKIRRIKRAMDRSRRNSNPRMFTSDGQIVRRNKLPAELLNKRGRRIWIKTKRYKRLEMRLRAIYRKQAAYRKHLHRRMANKLLSMSDEFYVEKMNWKALSKRSKETKRNQKGKFLSKKRFGKSIANKAPASFINILEAKATAAGGIFQRIDTWEAKASQFNHVTGKCSKKRLSKRWHTLEDGMKVQRDLYSAFLIQHINKDLKSFDVEACKKDFTAFLAMHQKEIERLQSLDKKMPSSMGIRKAA